MRIMAKETLAEAGCHYSAFPGAFWVAFLVAPRNEILRKSERLRSRVKPRINTAWPHSIPVPVFIDLARATDPLGRVTRSVVHQDTSALKQVRAGIGRLGPALKDMRQGRLDHLSGMVCRLGPRTIQL